MAFRKMTSNPYPPRMWSLVGYPGMGKSTFASQLRGPMLVVDADHRFSEVMNLAADEIYELSDSPSDNVHPDTISRLLNKNMPGSDVKTIVVDSLTAIITPLVVQALVDYDSKRIKNLSAGFRTKALAVRQLQDAVTRWGCDVLWIYHLQDSRDGKAKEVTRTSISQTEIARLARSMNLQLQIVEDNKGKRGIKVLWARRGRNGMVIWDESGYWKGMPEKIEAAVYDGLTKAEQDKIESSVPEAFPNAETALAWALEQNAFTDVEDAREAYQRVKEEFKPRSAKEMANYWVAEVQRLAEEAAAGDAPPPEVLNGVHPPPEEPMDATPF